MRPSIIAVCLAAFASVLVVRGYSPIAAVMVVAGGGIVFSVALLAVIAALSDAPGDVWIYARNEFRRCVREMFS